MIMRLIDSFKKRNLILFNFFLTLYIGINFIGLIGLANLITEEFSCQPNFLTILKVLLLQNVIKWGYVSINFWVKILPKPLPLNSGRIAKSKNHAAEIVLPFTLKSTGCNPACPIIFFSSEITMFRIGYNQFCTTIANF